MKRFDVHCSHEELQQMNKITQTQNTAYTRDTFDVSQTFRQVLNAVMSSRGVCVCVWVLEETFGDEDCEGVVCMYAAYCTVQ